MFLKALFDINKKCKHQLFLLPLNGLGYQNLLQCQHEEYQALDLLHPLQLRCYALLICICSMHPAFSSKHTEVILWSISKQKPRFIIFLTHFWPMLPFHTLYKHQNTNGFPLFSGVCFCCFSKYKMGTLARNELISFHILNILRQHNSHHLLAQRQQTEKLEHMKSV